MGNKDKRISTEYFNDIAKEYDYDIIPEPNKCYRILLDKLPKSAKTLVDVGCGTGTMLKIIDENLDGIQQLVGVDISEKMIEEASKKKSRKVSFMVGDVEHLPFDDNCFDIVICMHSFHHYPKAQEAINEMFRVCSKGGQVYIVENYKTGLSRIMENLKILFWVRRKKGDIKIYLISEIEKFMNRSNAVEITNELLTENSFLVRGTK